MADLNAYQGNAELGYGSAGNGAGALGTYTPKISVDAADKLAYYDFLQQKDEWAKKNADKDADAKAAADTLNFSYGDFLQQDRQQIDDAVSALTKAYTDDPTAVTLKLGADGKATNADAHVKLTNLKRTVADTIKRANIRAAQNSALNAQVKELKGADEAKLENFQKWHQQELSKSFDQDIMLFPDIDVFDLNGYLASVKPNKISFDHTTGQGTNYLTPIHTDITDLQGLRSSFSADYATKPTLAKAFDSKYNTFQGIIAEATDPNSGQLDMAKLRKSSGGQLLLQMQNDANAFITNYNDPAVLKNGGTTAVASINLADGLNQEELFTMLAASKLNKETASKVDYTGDLNVRTKNANEENQSKRSFAAATQKTAPKTELGEKVFRDVDSIYQQAGDANAFKEISLTPSLVNALSIPRDNTIKREDFDSEGAFESAMQKNLKTPKKIAAKVINGKLQVRAYYEGEEQKDKKGNALGTTMFTKFTEFNENDLVSNFGKAYAGGKTQSEVDEQIVNFRRANLSDRRPLGEQLRSRFATENNDVPPEMPAGAEPFRNPTTGLWGYILNGKKYVQD